MTTSDDDIFWQAMDGVKPIQRQDRVRDPRRKNARDASVEWRRQAAMTAPSVDNNPLTDRDDVSPLDPWFVLDFKRPGVQNGVFRKLRQGRYEVEASLDLHRMTVAIARRELFDFIADSQTLGLRLVMVVHGKGESAKQKEQSAILKGYTQHWLQELAPVMAFHSAQPRHGGTGAVYVLLQKSEAKKRENRERFMKGRQAPD